MSLKFDNKTYSDKIVSCSVDVLIDLDLGSWVPVFNDDGPVYGPNGQWELDPNNDQCSISVMPHLNRPVFATCKNNCPGGELSVISSELFCNNLVTNISSS